MVLERLLKEAPLGFSPYPFYMLNGPVDGTAWAEDLRALRAKGVGGAFLHPRHGMKGEYLGPEYLKALKEATAAAVEAGFDACLYDEFNWPSGSCEGKVAAKRREWRGQYVTCTQVELKAGQNLTLKLAERPLALHLLLPDEAGDLDLERAADFDSPETEEYVISTATDVVVFLFEVKDAGYVDVTEPKATETFLTLTHRRVRKALGRKLMRQVVPAVFSDEASLLSIWDVQDKGALPWSKRLARAFKKTKGYDLVGALPALYADVGPLTTRVRQDYWEVLSTLYVEAFWQPQADWCKRNKLALCGHLLNEEALAPQVKEQGDIFEVLRRFTFPGVDNLQFSCKGLHHKLASSIAHQEGRRRVLSESWGASGWDNALNERKHNADWQITRGINFFVPHGHYQTVYGARKRESPPSLFTQQPFFEHYEAFSDYLRRACYCASAGRHVAEALVLYPLRSAWAHFTPEGRDELFAVVEQGLFNCCQALEKLHVDYDFVDEKALQRVEVAGGELKLADETFQVLVIPPSTTLSKTSMKHLLALAKAGGRIVGIAPVPFEDETGATAGFSKSGRLLWGEAPEEIFDKWRKGETPPGAKRNPRTGAVLLQAAAGGEAPQAEELVPLLSEVLQPYLKVQAEPEGAHLIHLCRETKDARWWFLANIGERGGTFELVFEAAGVPARGDCTTGEVRADLDWRRLDTRCALVRLDLAAGESVIVSFEQAVPFYEPVEAVSERRESLRIENWRVQRLGPNWANLPQWRWKAAGEDIEGELAEVGEDWPQLPPPASVGWHPPLEPLVQHLPERAWFKAFFLLEGGASDLQVVLEPLDVSFALAVNGTFVALERDTRLDRYFLGAAIQPYVREGANVLSLLVDYRKAKVKLPDHLHRITYDLVPERARLGGEFHLHREGEIPVLGAPGDLEGGIDLVSQGLPDFSGLVRYEATFELATLPAYAELDLGTVYETARLWVNDRLCDTRAFKPYRFEVTSHLKPGENRLRVEVANTAANVLVQLPRPSGLIGPVELHFSRGGATR